MDTDFELIQVSRSGSIAVVAMDREDKRNAMNEPLLTQLRAALQRQQQADEIAVVVLTGKGTVFCSGADRSAVARLEGEERTRVFAPIAAHLSELIGEVVFQVVSMSKLVVCAVNGHAAGGGMITALGCDFRVTSEEALFWMPEIELGRAISEPAMETLLAYVGPALTKDIVVTGRRIGANEMARFGLVNRIVPRSDVMAASLDFAQSLAKLDRQAVSKIKLRANSVLVKIWGNRGASSCRS
jgi:enoyl-CoA hydratase/carnithine racemase